MAKIEFKSGQGMRLNWTIELKREARLWRGLGYSYSEIARKLDPLGRVTKNMVASVFHNRRPSSRA